MLMRLLPGMLIRLLPGRLMRAEELSKIYGKTACLVTSGYKA
ncbi:unnamed protein product, partial [Staurois parvus]